MHSSCMKKIIDYVRNYFTETDKRILLLSSFFVGVFIFINYYFGLNRYVSSLNNQQQYAGWYIIFLIAFSFAYMLLSFLKKENVFSNKNFLLLFLVTPAIFSWKMVFDINIHFSNSKIQNTYWNQVVYWPFKLIVVSTVLFIIWKMTKEKQAFYGTRIKNFSFQPYLLMLLIMMPLIALASTQHDFLSMYPKLKSVSFLKNQHNSGWYKLLYELSYGSDFISIELFFRGFLVLAFAKWFGKDAILPMACFYCTIHFGKPLGECISSYFGGLILGIVIYNTRTIFGGLIVHLGIAWMMEIGGYLGNLYLS
jgi:hypothetical protein